MESHRYQIQKKTTEKMNDMSGGKTEGDGT